MSAKYVLVAAWIVLSLSGCMLLPPVPVNQETVTLVQRNLTAEPSTSSVKLTPTDEPPTREVIQATPALSATHTATASPIPSVTSTPTPTSTETTTATTTPVPIPTVLPTLTPEPTPTSSEPVASAAEASVGFQFLPRGEVRLEPGHPCPGCPHAPGYVIGNVFDAGGRPLCGVRVLCYNDWHRYPVVGTKGGGEYDIPVIQAATTWKVSVVDEMDQPLSPEVEVPFDPLVGCWYRLDWQRVD